MRNITACVLCDHHRFQPIVDLVASLTPGRDAPRTSSTFMVCRNCGFVFQNPTLDDRELDELYGQGYREYDPPEGYQRDQKAYGQILCEWVEKRIGATSQRRRVLEVGCAAGFFLSVFRENGWDVVGIDANPRWVAWGREHLGLDLHVGFFGEDVFRGEEFDLIVFSHVLEHLPDPVPTLKAIRAKVRSTGSVFIGTPNVFLPPRETLSANFFARPHVCLYSPRTVQRILAKAWLEVSYQDNWYPRGMRVLARPISECRAMTDEQADDWKAIHHLYVALTHSAPASTFGRNLASLVFTHYDALLQVAAKTLAMHSRWKGQTAYGIMGSLERDEPVSDHPEGQVVDASTSQEVDGWPLTLLHGTVLIMIGFGTGQAAEALLEELDRTESRLVICEPDPSIVRIALAVRNLTKLLDSPRVQLVVGPTLVFRRRVRTWIGEAADLRFIMNPWLGSKWQCRYRSIVDLVKKQCLHRLAVETGGKIPKRIQ